MVPVVNTCNTNLMDIVATIDEEARLEALLAVFRKSPET